LFRTRQLRGVQGDCNRVLVLQKEKLRDKKSLEDQDEKEVLRGFSSMYRMLPVDAAVSWICYLTHFAKSAGIVQFVTRARYLFYGSPRASGEL